MKAEHTRWSRRYQTALRKHIEQDPGASLQPALRLGRQAAALGLETLDLAGFHEQALRTLVSPGGSSGTRRNMVKRAKRFFNETIVPIEKTHRAALKADDEIRQSTLTLRRRAEESAASTRKLEDEIVQRKTLEATLKKNEKDNRILLEESRRLQNRLREQTGEVLSAQEEERRKTSCRLQDEIAQPLLAIHLRLLTLRTSDKTNTGTLVKEIANTQQMILKFTKTTHRLTHETGDHNET